MRDLLLPFGTVIGVAIAAYGVAMWSVPAALIVVGGTIAGVCERHSQ